MKRLIPALFITLISGVLFGRSRGSGIEFSAPMRWRCEAYLARLAPKSEFNFVDGMIDVSVDMLSLSTSGGFELSMFGRAAIWTGMGHQWEDVIFDPRNMHYSLVPGFRTKFANLALQIAWYHDCFHDVDRKEEPTIIWNLFELRLSPATHPAKERRKMIRMESCKCFRFRPHLDWEFAFGVFPTLKSPAWFQYTHPFTTVSEVNIKFSFIQIGDTRVEFKYNPMIWTHHGSKLSHRQYIEIALDYYGRDGTMSFFWGYTAHEDQPIRPKNGLTWVGFRWEL